MIKKPFLAFLAGSILMLPVFFARSWIPGNDSDYHIAMALHPFELAASGSLPWIHWSYLRDSFVNHHIGFQFAMSPLVIMSDRLAGSPVPGGQAGLMICMGFTALCLYRILCLRSVPVPLVWVMLLGVMPWHFWMRMANFRAPAIALPMLLFAIELFLRRKYLALFLWAACSVLVYFGAVLFAVVAGGMLVGLWLDERFGSSLRQAGVALVAGLAAGFLIHPAFPECLDHLRVQLFETGLSGAAEIGNEWKPPPAWDALVMWLPVLALFGFSLAFRLRHPVRTDGAGIALLLIAFVFCVLAVKARRFVEYAPVFVVLAAADFSRSWAPVMLSGCQNHRSWRWAGSALLALAALSGPLQARLQAVPGKADQSMVSAMNWLKAYSDKGSMVMTDDWDLFPACFKLNRHNIYAVGLDPMFTMRSYPEIWTAYRELTRGRPWAPEDIARVIRADYVLVRNDHPRFYQRLQSRPDLFSLVFPAVPGNPQPEVVIFRVLKPSPDADGAAAKSGSGV